MRQKSVLNMFNNRFPVLENDRNDVETSIEVDIVLEDVSVRSGDETRLFLMRHGKVRVAIIVILPRLHFHDDQFFSVQSDNVDFFMSVAPIPLEDFVTLFQQVVDCNFLTQFP